MGAKNVFGVHLVDHSSIPFSELPQTAADVIASELEYLRDPVYVRAEELGNPKLTVAHAIGKHDTIGADYIARCVNNLVSAAARPVFFRSIVSGGDDCDDMCNSIFSGIDDGCRRSGCGLVGGRTMEYNPLLDCGRYSLAGSAVGIGERSGVDKRNTACVEDILIGLSSSGVHSSGFDVIDRVFEMSQEFLGGYQRELSCSMGEELLRPTRTYVAPVMQMVISNIKIKAVCSIGDGGLPGCLPYILGDGVSAEINTNSYPMHNIFEIIQRQAAFSDEDMFDTFNMGIGLVIAVDKEDVGSAVEAIVRCGERPFIIGRCVKGNGSVVLL